MYPVANIVVKGPLLSSVFHWRYNITTEWANFVKIYFTFRLDERLKRIIDKVLLGLGKPEAICCLLAIIAVAGEGGSIREWHLLHLLLPGGRKSSAIAFLFNRNVPFRWFRLHSDWHSGEIDRRPNRFALLCALQKREGSDGIREKPFAGYLKKQYEKMFMNSLALWRVWKESGRHLGLGSGTAAHFHVCSLRWGASAIRPMPLD